MQNSLKLMPILIFMFCLNGCSTVQQMVADSFPTYDETVQNWPKLDENHSRFFLYSPNGKFIDFDTYCKVTLDGVDYGGMLQGTFMFIDVKAGEHTVYCTKTNKPKLSVNTKGGEIVYIDGISPLVIVNIEDVQGQLKGLNHAFEEALPYDDQPFTIKRRSKE